MQKHFAEVYFQHVDVFYDSKGGPTQSGFVQFSSPKLARKVLDKVVLLVFDRSVAVVGCHECNSSTETLVGCQ